MSKNKKKDQETIHDSLIRLADILEKEKDILRVETEIMSLHASLVATICLYQGNTTIANKIGNDLISFAIKLYNRNIDKFRLGILTQKGK